MCATWVNIENIKEVEWGPFFPKLCACILDNNSSPYGKFNQILFPFSSKFPDLNFASYVLSIYPHGTHSEPRRLPVHSPGKFLEVYFIHTQRLLWSFDISFEILLYWFSTLNIKQSDQNKPPVLTRYLHLYFISKSLKIYFIGMHI